MKGTMKKLFALCGICCSLSAVASTPLSTLEIPPGTIDGQVLTYFGPANVFYPKTVTTYQTNVLNAILTTATPTNTATLYPGGGYWFLVSTNPCAITNTVGAVAGYISSGDFVISNATAAAFTNYMNLMKGLPRGSMATNFAAVLGFNGAVVPASAELFIHIETRGVNETNYWLSY